MYVIFLTFAENRARASELMDGHKAWIRKGVSDGVFLLVGSLTPNAGGAILARGENRESIEARISEDPFVAEAVVTAQIHEIAPSLAALELSLLLPQPVSQ